MSLVDKVKKAIEELNHSNLVDFTETISTLLIYVTNILAHPTTKKYRKIKISNIHYFDRMGHIDPAGTLLKSIDLLKAREYIQTVFDDSGKKLQNYEKEYSQDYVWNSVKYVSCHSTIGIRNKMEDEHMVKDNFNNVDKCGYFSVFDGHGGRDSVNFVIKAFHINLASALKQHPEKDVCTVFNEVYCKTDAQIRRNKIVQSGTTAVTSLLRCEGDNRVLYTANVGDTRVVLYRNKEAVRITKEHKASEIDENERIVKAGGFVGRSNRVNGILAVSRSLGDHMLKDVIIPDPYTRKDVLIEGDEFLILACDGLWDVMTDEEACSYVVQRMKETQFELKNMEGEGHLFEISKIHGIIPNISKELCELALQKNTMDNVTVLVIWL